MSSVEPLEPEGLRIVLCLEFETHAPREDVADFKTALLALPNTVSSVEATGAFDFIAEISAPDLGWYHRWLKGLAETAASVMRRHETSFISRRFTRRDIDANSIWVPVPNGMKRIDCHLIDKVSAEGDYVRIHANGKSWLLHATMRSLAERLDPLQFIRLHRSLIVQCTFITRLVHEERNWTAVLGDGTRERIAKSRTTDALKMTRLGSASSSDGVRLQQLRQVAR